jgi:hypothetical protein
MSSVLYSGIQLLDRQKTGRRRMTMMVRRRGTRKVRCSEEYQQQEGENTERHSVKGPETETDDEQELQKQS